jgi:hypothetical protein
VLASQADELLVVCSLQVVPARALDRAHVYLLGLWAFTVWPRAPNFSALRRVSSNADRAYVSTRSPVSIASKP